MAFGQLNVTCVSKVCLAHKGAEAQYDCLHAQSSLRMEAFAGWSVWVLGCDRRCPGEVAYELGSDHCLYPYNTCAAENL